MKLEWVLYITAMCSRCCHQCSLWVWSWYRVHLPQLCLSVTQPRATTGMCLIPRPHSHTSFLATNMRSHCTVKCRLLSGMEFESDQSETRLLRLTWLVKTEICMRIKRSAVHSIATVQLAAFIGCLIISSTSQLGTCVVVASFPVLQFLYMSELQYGYCKNWGGGTRLILTLAS